VSDDVEANALQPIYPDRPPPVWLALNEHGRLRHYNPADREIVLAWYEHAAGIARAFGYCGA
jgi:hypothetical protein